MIIRQVVSNVFEGFELSDIQSMFGYKGQELEDTYDTAVDIMCCVQNENRLEDIKYVVSWFKKNNLMIRPTHMIKNGKSWVGAWIWEGPNDAACCISCGYEVRMTKPKEAIEVGLWLAENGYTPIMDMRPVVDGHGRSVFVMGYKREGNQHVCKLSRLLPNCHPRSKTYLDIDNNVKISMRS